MLINYKIFSKEFLFTALLSCQFLMAQTPAAAQLAKDNTSFAVDLYIQLKSKDGNLLFSPYSISTALAMTYAGAKGDTEQQMAKTLRFSLSQTQLHNTFKELESTVNAVQKSGDIELSIANSLWPQLDYPFLKSYLALIENNYSAKITPLDYHQHTEASRNTINSWVESKTNNKIKELIAPGLLDASTRLVVTNAVYFKGKWILPFSKSMTNDETFHISPNHPAKVPMMHQKEYFGYLETKDLQVLAMPYMGKQISIMIILPRKADTLENIEKQLTADKIAEWKTALRSTQVEVTLPKFKFTSMFMLNESLYKMGMRDAFSEKANFAGMNGKPHDLYISAVIHKAFIELNEEGTEAAASTAVVMAKTMAPMPSPIAPSVFKADHPFAFVIYENTTDTVLFMGKVSDPK